MQTRRESLEQAQGKTYDLLIIGGGIVGAGIAHDATNRGMSVLLVEKDDFGSGTSSKTTKLIHGGLRYLEQLHFRLTRELCQERGLLESLAPHLVRDLSLVLPVLRNKKLFGLKAGLGLTLYDALSGHIAGSKRHESLSRHSVLECAPFLDPNEIVGGLRFHDCVTDDTRLVIEVLKTAQSNGANLINYVEAQDIRSEGDKKILVCRDRMKGQDLSFSFRSCVNATGVWSDELNKRFDTSWKSNVKPAKGIHIVVPYSALETNTALFLPSPDERYVFLVPWQKALMIGTTDTNYQGSLDNPLPELEEIDFLLSVVNHYTKRSKLKREDVIAAWAGLRPLVSEGEGDSAGTANMSREHKIFVGPHNTVGIVGGKLTNFRILAQQVVDKALEQFSTQERGKFHPSTTDRVMLGGYTSREDYLTQTAVVSTKARSLGLEPAVIDHLISSYGSRAEHVLELVQEDESLSKRICSEFPPIMAEVVYTIKHEMAISLSDILFRRIRLGLVHQAQALDAVPKVARLVQNMLGWDNARTSAEIAQINTMLESHMIFKEAKVHA
ncbi:MAG: glycerol-3-phosphate dehydrogenase/oxidase [Cyanobacteria bacterium TGS_CYA1]|nr:glycerol-3-phosphate dehydrogenase/oxidase [Cyanobacteria bacterium TGS_CYA1]